MSGVRMRVFIRAICALVLAPVLVAHEASAQDTSPNARTAVAPEPKSGRRPAAHSRGEEDLKLKLNSWTIGLAAGQLEGAPIRFAAELARVLDDGDNMRVLPIVTRGPFDNVFDLLYLRGVDAAIVHGDVLDYFAKDRKIAGIEQRISYLMPLFPAEVH